MDKYSTGLEGYVSKREIPGRPGLMSAVVLVFHLPVEAEEAEQWVEDNLAELLTAKTSEWHIENIAELKGGRIH